VSPLLRLAWRSSGIAAPIALALACGSSKSDPPVDHTGSCRAIAGACHRYDQGGGLPHECHELGHAGDDAACGPRKDACIAACPPVEAGADASHDDASTPDAGGDGSTSDVDAGDPCVAYCQCMADTCSTQAGYPFANPADCATACAQQAPEERACWPQWCAQAKSADATKTHLCEHAWGKFGLDECETL
jgi:hypothetical protein